MLNSKRLEPTAAEIFSLNMQHFISAPPDQIKTLSFNPPEYKTIFGFNIYKLKSLRIKYSFAPLFFFFLLFFFKKKYNIILL